MNDQNDMGNGNEDADHDLLQALKRGQRGSSAAHDNAVLAKAAAAAKDMAGPEVDPLESVTQPRQFAWMLAAAAVAAIMLVPMLNMEPTDTLRNQDAAVEPAANASLTVAPTRFSWPFVPGADRYTLVLRDAGADELWRSAPVPEPQLTPDSSAQGLLNAGGTFIWTIEATTSGATTELGPFQFTVAD